MGNIKFGQSSSVYSSSH